MFCVFDPSVWVSVVVVDMFAAVVLSEVLECERCSGVQEMVRLSLGFWKSLAPPLKGPPSLRLGRHMQRLA